MRGHVLLVLDDQDGRVIEIDDLADLVLVGTQIVGERGCRNLTASQDLLGGIGTVADREYELEAVLGELSAARALEVGTLSEHRRSRPYVPHIELLGQ